MREIVLDTETTGLNAEGGDRIIEIGCIELINFIPSGRDFHRYINPERGVPRGAFEVHGLSTEFLADKPLFAAVADDFLDFIGEARLVIHNASFDIGFLNAELGRIGRPLIGSEQVLDTLALARRKHPGASNSLDALCKRYNVDASSRSKHGALIDSELLAKIYVELVGGHQAALQLEAAGATKRGTSPGKGKAGGAPAITRPRPLAKRLSEAERTAHAEFIGSLGETALWRRYSGK